MSSNVQKTPIARTLNEFAERKILGAMTLLGQSLPASVVAVVSSGIVTVKFELTGTPYTLPNVTVPLEGSEYVRLPIQAGCLGWVTAASAYLGGVSGLGGGTADLSPRGNLSSLVFSPLGNKNWSTTEDPRKLVLYGPDGAILRDLGKNSSVEVNATDATVSGKTTATIKVGAISVVVTADGIVFNGPVTFENNVGGAGGVVNFGSSNLTTSGQVTANGIPLSTHRHGGVTTGGGNTTGPEV